MFWSPHNLQHVTQGRWLVPPTEVSPNLRGLSTDSRAIQRGQIFLALRGDKFDGHDHVSQARAAGAGMLVVSKPVANSATGAAQSKIPTLLVPDTLAALQQLAAAYRNDLRQRGTKVIAVVGSNGKTTTRHLIHAVLSARYRGTQSPKSFNNHIGVPLTLLGASLGDTADAFVVVEVGTNHPGEIEALAKIVRPDAVVLTSIGHEHMEFFGTLEGVAAEETAILPHVAADGAMMLPGDAATVALLAPHLARLPAGVKQITFGQSPGDDLAIGDVQSDATGVSFSLADGQGQPTQVQLSFPGDHNALNAAAALAVGRWMGVPMSEAIAALANVMCVGMRMEVSRIPADAAPHRQLVLINDAYNANPDSVIAALRTLASFPLPSEGEGGRGLARPGEGDGVAQHESAAKVAGLESELLAAPIHVHPHPSTLPQKGEGAGGRRIAILGDMRELGQHAPDLHRKVGQALAALAGGIDKAILIGPLSLYTAEALSRHWPPQRIHTFAQWTDDLPQRIAALLQGGDVVLLKASRGMALERLIPAMETRVSNCELRISDFPQPAVCCHSNPKSETRNPK
ncbi:MAG: UDP-N-acetylmuramoyl-tripeptide--D-alanyl-D-alanine ligase [Phycisphaeraceae bacterium]